MPRPRKASGHILLFLGTRLGSQGFQAASLLVRCVCVARGHRSLAGEIILLGVKPLVALAAAIGPHLGQSENHPFQETTPVRFVNAVRATFWTPRFQI